MRRTLFAIAAGATAAAVAVAAAVVPAFAEASISQIGWWTRNPIATAPEDGFAVARAPDGDLSVAALGVFSTGDLTKATLILTEADTVNAGGAVLQVCFTPNEWSAGAKQRWADRPKAECDSGSAELRRNATSGTWAGDVLSVLSAADEDASSVSMMIVPGEGSAPAFELRFRAAELQVEEAEEDSFSSDFGGSDFSSGSGSDSGSDFSGGSDFSSESDGGSNFSSGSDFGTPPAPAAPTDTAVGDEPVGVPDIEPAEDEGEGTIGGDDFAISAARTGADEATGNTTLQAVFFVAVALAAGAAAGFGRHLLSERLA